MTKRWTRRELLEGTAVSSAGVALQAVVPRLFAEPVGSPGQVIKTPLGSLRGQINDGTLAFRGVPFAEPPIGSLRFRPPAPAKPWSGVRDALTSAPAATQPGRTNVSEDCLYLNVFAPAGTGPFRSSCGFTVEASPAAARPIRSSTAQVSRSRAS